MADYTPTPKETTDEKNRLIRLVAPELEEHGLVDLTDFITKRGGEGFRHAGFVRSVAYRMEEMGIVEVIPRKEWTEFYIKRTIWSKRHPYRHAVLLGGIGVVFSIIAGISIALTQSAIRTKMQVESQKSEPGPDSTKAALKNKEIPNDTTLR